MKWRNSTDYPIRADAELSNGQVSIALVGTNATGQYAEIDYEQTAVVPFSTITTDDPDDEQSGYTGYTYVIVRRIYSQDGELLRTDTTADLDAQGGLGTSTYSKRDRRVYSLF